MSGILQIQRRHAPLFRIRLGQKNGKDPARLVGEIRVTSPNRPVVQAFAEVYGGRPKKWEKEHEVFMPISRLPITLLPGTPLNQSMELWGMSGCLRRCDSVTMQGGEPCACGPDKDIEDRECKPTTRLSFACPEVPIVGTGLLVTHSVIAASELPASLSMVEPVLAQNRPVSAVLRIDQMSTPGHNFAVPRIEFEGLSFQDIALAAASPPALGSGVLPEPLAIGGGE
jgi:hypothetical protein